MPLLVVDHASNTVSHRGDQRIGSSQIDAYREAVLVRRGGFTRLGYLQKGHQTNSIASMPSPISCSSFSIKSNWRAASAAG